MPREFWYFVVGTFLFFAIGMYTTIQIKSWSCSTLAQGYKVKPNYTLLNGCRLHMGKRIIPASRVWFEQGSGRLLIGKDN